MVFFIKILIVKKERILIYLRSFSLQGRFSHGENLKKNNNQRHTRKFRVDTTREALKADILTNLESVEKYALVFESEFFKIKII